jgi:hypothetical protein
LGNRFCQGKSSRRAAEVMEKKKMNYTNIVTGVINTITNRYDWIVKNYPISVNEDYCKIASKVKSGATLLACKNNIMAFYNLRGIKGYNITKMLVYGDQQHGTIAQVAQGQPDAMYPIYEKMVNTIKPITGRCERVNVSKLLNLCNNNYPLFDNKVLNCLMKLGFTTPYTKKYEYYDIMMVYKGLMESKDFMEIFHKLLLEVYKNKMTLYQQHKCYCLKMLDTFMWLMGKQGVIIMPTIKMTNVTMPTIKIINLNGYNLYAYPINGDLLATQRTLKDLLQDKTIRSIEVGNFEGGWLHYSRKEDSPNSKLPSPWWKKLVGKPREYVTVV